jgi:hypothetical protein
MLLPARGASTKRLALYFAGEGIVTEYNLGWLDVPVTACSDHELGAASVRHGGGDRCLQE